MNRVYVVVIEHQGCVRLDRIFSTRERAEETAEELNRQGNVNEGNATVEEWDVED